MNTGPVAYRYAKALLKYVGETGAGEKVYSQACVLVLRMQELRQFADVIMKHPELPLERKEEMMGMALGEPVAAELLRFTRLVQDQRRMECFERILYSFIDQYRSANSMKIGRVVTACQIPGLKDNLQDILSKEMKSSVILEEAVDSSIIGGFILNIDDLRMDASVSGRFRLLRRELMDKGNRIV